MKSLESVIQKLDQLDSLMYSVEGALIDAAEEIIGSETKRLHNLFYLLWEQLQQVTKDVEEVNGNIEVCNAIYAVNHVEEMKRELAELKKA